MSDLDRNYASPFGRAAGRVDAATVDAGLRAYMLRIYNYMSIGLAITGLAALGFEPVDEVVAAMHSMRERLSIVLGELGAGLAGRRVRAEGGRVAQHPQRGLRAVDLVVEEILGQAQVQREGPVQALAHRQHRRGRCPARL